jgi:PKD repeat protein
MKENKKLLSIFVVVIVVASAIAAAVTFGIMHLEEEKAEDKEPLNVKIFVDKREGTTPLTVRFSSMVTNSKGDVEYYWDLGNGNTSEEREPSVVYQENGTYICNLTLTDGSGEKATDSIYILALINKPPTVSISLGSKNPSRPYLPGTIKTWSGWADNFWGRKLRRLIEILPNSSSLLNIEGFVYCKAVASDPEGDEIVSYKWILEPHPYTFMGTQMKPQYVFEGKDNEITFPLLYTYGPSEAKFDVKVIVTDSMGNTREESEIFTVQKSSPETIVDVLNIYKNAFRNFVWVPLIAPNLPGYMKESFADSLWSFAEKAPLPVIETYLKIKIFKFLFQWNLLSLRDPAKAIVRFADSFTSLIEKYPALLKPTGEVLDLVEKVIIDINVSFLSDLTLPAIQDVRELWGLSNYIPDISNPNPADGDKVYNLNYPNVSVSINDVDATPGDWFNVTISGECVQNESWNYANDGIFSANLTTPLPVNEEIFWHVEVVDYLGRIARETYSFYV